MGEVSEECSREILRTRFLRSDYYVQGNFLGGIFGGGIIQGIFGIFHRRVFRGCSGNIRGIFRWVSICISVQDYKSPRVAGKICASLVNTQTHIL